MLCELIWRQTKPLHHLSAGKASLLVPVEFFLHFLGVEEPKRSSQGCIGLVRYHQLKFDNGFNKNERKDAFRDNIKENIEKQK